MKEDARTALRLFEQVAANGSFVREADVDQILLNDRSADFAAIVRLRTKVRFGKTHPEKPDQKRKQYSQSCQGRFNNCGCTGGIYQCN